ncbi:MAG: hypothetical protein GY795_51660 [Desulfobacterales bacterium]|nr:hypothetical protein [Desulfobacterales bacterium]
MKFWQPPDSVPKFHFGTPSDCQLKNEGCQFLVPMLRVIKLKEHFEARQGLCSPVSSFKFQVSHKIFDICYMKFNI